MSIFTPTVFYKVSSGRYSHCHWPRCKIFIWYVHIDTCNIVGILIWHVSMLTRTDVDKWRTGKYHPIRTHIDTGHIVENFEWHVGIWTRDSRYKVLSDMWLYGHAPRFKNVYLTSFPSDTRHSVHIFTWHASMLRRGAIYKISSCRLTHGVPFIFHLKRVEIDRWQTVQKFC